MKCAICLILLLLPGCQASAQQDGIVSQASVADIACGPCSLYNWLSHGNAELQGVLAQMSTDKTPVQTVQSIIDKYGMRDSATKPSVTRYGPHNGGVGSVNLMIMAREILHDHLESPPKLEGHYLQRHDDESAEQHLQRIAGWFRGSIESGVPVIFYARCYSRTTGEPAGRLLFGHHVVITSVDPEFITTKSGYPRVRIKFIDPADGTVNIGRLCVSETEFTAPTFTYQLTDGRASTTTKIRSGRPLLELRALRFGSPKSQIVTAHFATFADTGR